MSALTLVVIAVLSAECRRPLVHGAPPDTGTFLCPEVTASPEVELPLSDETLTEPPLLESLDTATVAKSRTFELPPKAENNPLPPPSQWAPTGAIFGGGGVEGRLSGQGGMRMGARFFPGEQRVASVSGLFQLAYTGSSLELSTPLRAELGYVPFGSTTSIPSVRIGALAQPFTELPSAASAGRSGIRMGMVFGWNIPLALRNDPAGTSNAANAGLGILGAALYAGPYGLLLAPLMATGLLVLAMPEVTVAYETSVDTFGLNQSAAHLTVGLGL